MKKKEIIMEFFLLAQKVRNRIHPDQYEAVKIAYRDAASLIEELCEDINKKRLRK